MNKDDVNVAFDLLLEGLQQVMEAINEEIATTTRAKQFDDAQALIEHAKRLVGFQAKVESLREDWRNLFMSPVMPRRVSSSRGKRFPRLRKGLMTHEDEFRRPILEALVELGGRAHKSLVIRLVGEKMKDKLNEYDRQYMPNRPGVRRWEYRVEWCKSRLAMQGLARSTRPKGTWEITSEGRRALEAGEM